MAADISERIRAIYSTLSKGQKKIANAVLSWCDIDSFELKLPANQLFSSLDLTVDQSKDIKKIETNE